MSRSSRVVLDIGAGIRPFRGATHAVDRATKRELEEELQATRRSRPRVRYKTNWNVLTRGIPLPDDSVDKVVSRFTGNIVPAVLDEVDRVLKSGGTVQFTTPTEYAEGFKKLLEGEGMLNVRISNVYDPNRNTALKYLTATKP